ncbi:MAG: hypothetical protein Q3985_02605 [Eubacteriales bacterium]|nr:hypothetical protein [Eubacteriales bacterium]
MEVKQKFIKPKNFFVESIDFWRKCGMMNMVKIKDGQEGDTWKAKSWTP